MRHSQPLISIVAAVLAWPAGMAERPANAAGHMPTPSGDVIFLAQDDTANPKTSLVIHVTGSPAAQSPGAPIPFARVILHLSNGKEVEGVTNTAGELALDDIPYGRLKIQVTKTGWETAGSRTELSQPRETLRFTLRPDAPPSQ